jgi:hypothetical protein
LNSNPATRCSAPRQTPHGPTCGSDSNAPRRVVVSRGTWTRHLISKDAKRPLAKSFGVVFHESAVEGDTLALRHFAIVSLLVTLGVFVTTSARATPPIQQAKPTATGLKHHVSSKRGKTRRALADAARLPESGTASPAMRPTVPLARSAPRRKRRLPLRAAAVTPPWFRAKPALDGRTNTASRVDPRPATPEYRCKQATISQCRDTSPNACSSQGHELRERVRRYGNLATPANIGMSLPLVRTESSNDDGPAMHTSTVLVAVATSAVGVKWRLTW